MTGFYSCHDTDNNRFSEFIWFFGGNVSTLEMCVWNHDTPSLRSLAV